MTQNKSGWLSTSLREAWPVFALFPVLALVLAVQLLAWLIDRAQAAEPADQAGWYSASFIGVGVLVATVAAIFIVGLFILQYRRDGRAGQDRSAREDDARRAQANQVAVWFGPDNHPDTAPHPAPSRSRGWILNASGSPIYQVVAEYRTPRDPDLAHYVALDGIVIPASEPALVSDPTAPDWVGEGTSSTIVSHLHFRDNSGRHWLRDALGNLLPQTPEQHAVALKAGIEDRVRLPAA